MEENAKPSLLNHAMRWGFILSALSIVIMMAMYAIDYTLMVQLKILLIILVVDLVVVVYAGIDFRKSIGGFLSYGKAWQHGFFLLITNTIIYTAFAILLYHVIDPELPEKLLDATLENTRSMMEGFGAPEDQIDKAMEDARKRSENQFTISGQLLGVVFSSIISAIICSITAAIVKRNEPVQM